MSKRKKGKPHFTPKVVAAYKPPERDDVMSRPPRPTIVFNAECMAKVDVIVRRAKMEIGFIFSVSKDDDMNYYVHDVRCPMPQDVSAGTFDWTDKAHGECVEHMIIDGSLVAGEGEPQRGDWGLGHSHVNMEVQPSGTDVDQMMEYYDQKQKFSVQTIHNKKGDMWVALYDYEHKVYYPEDELYWYVESILTNGQMDDLDAQVAAAKKVFTPSYYPATAHGSKYSESGGGLARDAAHWANVVDESYYGDDGWKSGFVNGATDTEKKGGFHEWERDENGFLINPNI